MKVLIIFLDYHRHDFTEQVKKQNLNNAGHPFTIVNVNEKGIAKAINYGIKFARALKVDSIVTMANDILMPDNWLANLVRHAEAIPNTGMAGIHCVEGLPELTEINGIKVHQTYTAFGNVLIPMKAVEAVGVFNEDYDPYGMQDADYAHRLNLSGFVNYYIQSKERQEHIGHDVGQETEYRKMKDEGLSLAGDKWGKWDKHYRETGNYIIDYPQYFDGN